MPGREPPPGVESAQPSVVGRTSGLQNHETLNVCCFSRPSLWNSVWQPELAGASGARGLGLDPG